MRVEILWNHRPYDLNVEVNTFISGLDGEFVQDAQYSSTYDNEAGAVLHSVLLVIGRIPMT